MPRIVDTTPAFVEFSRKAFLTSPVLREDAWRDQYEGAHRDLFDAFYAEQPSTDGRKALVRELAAVRDRVEAARPALTGIIEELDPQLSQALGAGAPPAAEPLHVLIVGPSSANAVVTRVGGDVALFHCLEWFRSPEGARVLVAHEGAHAWHEVRLGRRPPGDDLAWTAFSEGLAVAASRQLVPGRDDDDYFWFGYPGFEDWLGWCRDNQADLFARFRSSLGDAGAVEAFFGSGLIDGRWRTGFYVAAEVVAGLGRPLDELAGMSVEEGCEAVRAALGESG